MFRWGLLVTTIAACGFTPPAVHDAPPADAAIDAAPDAPPGACALSALTMQVTTLAGCSDGGTADGSRGLGRFNNPVNLVLSSSGMAYVADFDSRKLRKVDAAGKVTTLVDMPHPFGMAIASDGYLIVETDDDDMSMHSFTSGTVWRVNPATGAATVLARDIGRPRGVCVLPDGRIALTDQVRHVVELLDSQTGVVSVLAGAADQMGHVNATGGLARFSQPWDVVYDNGDLIVSEVDNGDLRRVTLDGVVSDVVPMGSLDQPQGLAIDDQGTLYVTEYGHSHDVKKVEGTTISLLAGSIEGYLDADDPRAAAFYGVEGLDVTPDGKRVVVADGNHGDGMAYNHIREIHQ
jgi:DNA-binding beta-propeller fold protein YncE